MSNWSAGYVAEIDYTYGYYTELNPQRLRLAFLNAGLAFPASGTACELGFGQGLSVNVHAAASLTSWYGTDFNPAQAGFAQELAQQSGASAQLFDQGFAEFCVREDLPEFDYIGLHGIWSWVSDENRAVIVDFIRRRLKVGGVLYISYNTQPAWASMIPMRDLLTAHSETLAAPGVGIVPRIDAALDFTEKLFATKPGFVAAYPHIVEKMKAIKKQDRHYLAHEYFNRDWAPMPFSRMAEWLAPTKLQFAGSAHYLEHIDAINITSEQIALLETIPDQVFRETVRDFIVNQGFRRDYWVKGARRLNAFDRAVALRQLRIILSVDRSAITLKVNGSLGEGNLSPEVYNPILDVLADYRSRTIGELEAAIQNSHIHFGQLMQALMLMTGAGYISTVQDDAVIEGATPQTQRLNAHLINKARGAAEIHYLASPVTGGGVQVGRFQQLFLLALDQGKKTSEELAQFVWQILSAQGQLIVKDGAALQGAQDNLAELSQQATQFLQKQLPVLLALKVV